jgi:hypothetical protein
MNTQSSDNILPEVDTKTECSVTIGPFNIDVIQPDPLPDFIQMLMKARTAGLKFTKLPVSDVEYKNFLNSHLTKLITNTGLTSAFVTDVLTKYISQPANADLKKNVICMMHLATLYADHYKL